MTPFKGYATPAQDAFERIFRHQGGDRIHHAALAQNDPLCAVWHVDCAASHVGYCDVFGK
jgi:hypothetical protein